MRGVIYVGRSAQRQNREAQLEINLTNTPDNSNFTQLQKYTNTTNTKIYEYTNTTKTQRQNRGTQRLI